MSPLFGDVGAVPLVMFSDARAVVLVGRCSAAVGLAVPMPTLPSPFSVIIVACDEAPLPSRNCILESVGMLLTELKIEFL